MRVRLATPGDVTRLVIFARSAHAASNYADIAYDASIMRHTFTRVIGSDAYDVLVAEREDGSLCGLLMCVCAPLPFSRARYATDLDFYAEQGGGVLLAAFIVWAKRHHAARIECGVTQDDARAHLDKLYERKGFRRAGRMYLMNLEHAL